MSKIFLQKKEYRQCQYSFTHHFRLHHMYSVKIFYALKATTAYGRPSALSRLTIHSPSCSVTRG